MSLGLDAVNELIIITVELTSSLHFLALCLIRSGYLSLSECDMFASNREQCRAEHKI